MAGNLGRRLGRGARIVEERVSLGLASPELAGKLSVAAGTPLLVLDRGVRTTKGVPVKWRLAECHLGHYLARLTRGGGPTVQC